jgi:hypothetical protein
MICADTNTIYKLVLGRPYSQFYGFRFIVTARDALCQEMSYEIL